MDLLRGRFFIKMMNPIFQLSVCPFAHTIRPITPVETDMIQGSQK